MPSLIRDNKTGFFFIVYTINGKRIWRSLKTKRRDAAQQRFLEAKDHDPADKKPSLSRSLEEYLSYVSTNFAPKTLRCYRETLKNFTRFFGKKKETSLISARDIELYKSNRSRKVAAQTVNHELRCIRAYFNCLIRWKLLEANPCAGVKDIRVNQTIPPYLSKDELRKLLDHTEGTQLHDIVLFGAMTGMRRGEIMGLRWNDLNFEQGTILVRSSQLHQTKAGKIRLVPMNSAVRALLEGLSRPTPYVFPGERGGMNNGNFVRARFKKAVRDCGLDPRLHFHSLRHTFASLLVRDGISLYHVQKLLGHSSARITEIYAHLGGVEFAQSVERLVSGFEGSCKGEDLVPTMITTT